MDQLDPLTAVPRDVDFQSARDDYDRSDEDSFKKATARMFGRHWEQAWKNGMHYPAPPHDSHDWRYSYQQPSIFEVDNHNDEKND